MKKYQLTFEFTETEEQARAAVERHNKAATPYMRKHHPAGFTPWELPAATDKAHFIVWFYR